SVRGTFWCALPITRTVLTVGSTTLPQTIAEIASGEWKARFDGRELDGDVKCGNGFLWGLRRALMNAGAEPGDFAVLEFDLSKRTVDINSGGEDLVDVWESGDIECPPAEINGSEAESDSVAEVLPDD